MLSRAGATFLPLRYDSQSVEQAGAGLFLKTATIRGAYSGTRDPGSEYVSEIAFSKETLFQLERTGVNPEILRMLLRFFFYLCRLIGQKQRHSTATLYRFGAHHANILH